MSELKAETGKSPEVTPRDPNSDDQQQFTKNRKRRNARRRFNKRMSQLQDIENAEAKLEDRPPRDVMNEYRRAKAQNAGSAVERPEATGRATGDESDCQESGSIIDAEVIEIEYPIDRSEAESPSALLPVHVPKIVQPQPDSERNSESGHDEINPFPYKSEQWWQHSKPEVQQTRCRAHTVTGDRCRTFALVGSRVCGKHGGAAPHVKAAARARLENASDALAQRLLGMTLDDSVKDSVKLAAIKDALDRAGLKAPEQVVISPGQQRPFEEIAEDIQFSTMTREQSRAMRGYVEPDSVAPQFDSDSWNGEDSFMDNGFGDTHTAPVGDDERPEHASHSDHDGAVRPPSGPQERPAAAP